MSIAAPKSSVNNAAALLTPKNLSRTTPATMITTKADLAAQKQTHEDFTAYCETDDAQANYHKLSQERIHGVGAWKLDQLQAQLTRQVMGQQGTDRIKLNALAPAERAAQEQAIMNEVDRRLQIMIEASLPMAGLAITNADDPRLAQAEAVPSLSRTAPLPPLMMSGGRQADSLQATASRAVAELFHEHGFAAQPPITLHVDDQGQIRVAGDRPDSADIEAALRADGNARNWIQSFATMAAGAVMLADQASTTSDLSDPTIDAATHRTAFQALQAQYQPRTSVLSFDGTTLAFTGTHASDAPAE